MTTPVRKSCANCPSFVNTSDETIAMQLHVAQKPTTVPMCGRFGDLLATHNSSPTQVRSIQERRASVCSRFGDEWDGTQADGEKYKFAVVKPAPNAPDNPNNVKAKACAACVNYLKPDTMMNSYGIPFPGCAKFGEVIPPKMGKVYAAECAENVQGFNALPPLGNLIPKPHLQNNLTFIDHDGTIVLGETESEDPAAYPTDKDVTDSDTTSGIRAWRKVYDPEDDERFIFLPIFDNDFFDLDEQSKIPAFGDDEHPELYQDHQGLAYKVGVLWMHMNETPALNGVAGVGKTECFRYLAYLMQVPFERYSITNSTELDDLAGRFVLEPMEDGGGNQTRFEYGRLPKAWSKPNVVCIDEPNTGPPDVWQFLRPLTDNSKQMVLDMNKGERIDRHRFCFLGMAMNPSWDIKNVGAHQISDADGSRLMHIAVPSPHEELERDILIRRCAVDEYKLPQDLLDAIIKIAKELRELASNDDSLTISWGTRQTIKVARLTQYFTLKQAHRMAAADLVAPVEAERILAIVTAHTPKKLIKPPKTGAAKATW
jgi:MoxR-like ATPase